MLFEEQHFGKPISELLSEYLKAHTTNNDIAIVSASTRVSMSTIKYVMYRTGSLTEANSVAMVEMVKRAIGNCKTKIEDSLKAKSYLESKFNTVQAS